MPVHGEPDTLDGNSLGGSGPLPASNEDIAQAQALTDVPAETSQGGETAPAGSRRNLIIVLVSGGAAGVIAAIALSRNREPVSPSAP